MNANNPVARLAESHPNAEVWWDSSPLVFADWFRSLGRPPIARSLLDMIGTDGDTPKFKPTSVLQGSTTNQPLTLQVIERNPETWGAWAASQNREEPDIIAEEMMWRLFIEIAARGADALYPIFEASSYRRGQICCQVHPRDLTNLEAMLAQARRIHSARPNIMVKMPGSKEGIEGVRILTREGIPTNMTLGFTVSQLIAVGEAAQAGLAEARALGTDLKHWRSCGTMMLGRYEDAPPLMAQARGLGIELTEADLRWAGIAIFRKAYRLYLERGYPTKLMAASMRLGPTIDGKMSVWHLEKLAGADAVLTVFPNILEAFMANYAERPIDPQIEAPVPDQVMERLLRIPYFVQAYEEKGIAPEDFVFHPALVATAKSFLQAMDQVEQFAARFVAVSPQTAN